MAKIYQHGIGYLEVWFNGEKARPLSILRPCRCGCDERSGDKGVGYITVSDAEGNGVSLWILTEGSFQRFERLINGGEHRCKAEDVDAP